MKILQEAKPTQKFLRVDTTEGAMWFAWDPFKTWVPKSKAEMQGIAPTIHSAHQKIVTDSVTEFMPKS